MNNKHSPGPWVATARLSVGFEHNRDTDRVIRNASGNGVAVVWMASENSREFPQCDADVRLIAGAPELLAALKSLLAAHVETQTLERDYSIDTEKPEADARALIARIEGTP